MVDAAVCITCQGSCSNGDLAAQRKGAIGEGIGGAGGGQGLQQVIFIGILHRLGEPCVRGGRRGGCPVHGVVGILRSGSGRILRVLHPFQNIGIGVVAVGGYLTQCIGGGYQTVAVGRIDLKMAKGDSPGKLNRLGCLLHIHFTAEGKSVKYWTARLL